MISGGTVKVQLLDVGAGSNIINSSEVMIWTTQKCFAPLRDDIGAGYYKHLATKTNYALSNRTEPLGASERAPRAPPQCHYYGFHETISHVLGILHKYSTYWYLLYWLNVCNSTILHVVKRRIDRTKNRTSTEKKVLVYFLAGLTWAQPPVDFLTFIRARYSLHWIKSIRLWLLIERWVDASPSAGSENRKGMAV